MSNRSPESRNEADGAARSPWGVPIALVAALACVGGAYWFFRRDEAESALPASSSAAPSVAMPGRCTTIGEDFVVGKLAATGDKPEPPPGIPGIDDQKQNNADEDAYAPFAALIARANANGEGLFLGVLVEGDGGMVSALATLGADGKGTMTKLARSRGDLEPPVVVSSTDGLVAGVLEPDGTGLKVRLARVKSGAVTWGGEVTQKLDESLAFDVGVGKSRGVLAWDETDGDASHVLVAGFDATTLATTGRKIVSPKKSMASAPRIFARPGGGFYVTYLAAGGAIDKGNDAPPGEPREEADDKEIDETKGGEPLTHAAIVVVPLDDNGAPASEAIHVTGPKGRVVAYDAIFRGDDLVFAFRDEEAESVGESGAVSTAILDPSGKVDVQKPLDDDVGDGAPVLLDGWLALPGLRGEHVLARMDATGKLVETPAVESSIGRGEPIAAAGDVLYLAVPDGKAMRLRATRCAAGRPQVPVAPSFSAAPAANDEL